MFKKRSIKRLFFQALLIMSAHLGAYGQEIKKDTLIINDSTINEIIYYSARDSIYSDLKNKQIHLFGDAKIDNGEMKMSAGYILVDLNKNELYARYAYDQDSNRTEIPKFQDGSEEMTAASIKYNLNTKKGYIEEMAIKQDEMYLYMGIAKRQSNDEIHFRQGRFTTCDLEEPHYHFQLSKAIMIPEKRIVTGPMNLWIKGVPTPFGLPFSMIPQQKNRTRGLIFPEIVPSSQYGFGFQNLGYYLPINSQLQTTIYANLYSRGSFGLRNYLEYYKMYGFKGTFDVQYQRYNNGFPTNTRNNKVTVIWSHTKDSKSNPYWTFNSAVNFISDNQTKNSLDPINSQYFNNTMASDISLSRSFPGKPVTMGAKISMRQNTLSKNISLTSPVFNVNVTRFFPLKKFVKKTSTPIGKMLTGLGISYSMEGKNISTFGDSLLTRGEWNAIGNEFMNGIYQTTTIQTTSSVFKSALKITPYITYANRINFQQISKNYNIDSSITYVDTLSRAGMWHDLTFNLQLTTVVYSYYKYVGKNKPVLRHIMTPSVTLKYIPQLNTLSSYYVGADSAVTTYNPNERSLYTGYTGKTTAQISFGINNTFELKRISEKDSTGYKKTRLIDQFSINGYYDLMKDSMKLSDLSLNLRISPASFVNFVSTSTFSPYAWNDSTGVTIKDYALNSKNKLGRFTSTTFTTTFVFASKESKDKMKETQDLIGNTWNADYNYYALHPEFLIDFNIPWKATVSHNLIFTANTSKTGFDDKQFNTIHTLAFTGDLSFTKRWKIATIANYNVQTSKLTNVSFTLSRNMHCWALSFYWVPIGTNKSFLFSLKNTSKLFQDAKINLRKPPVFN